MDLAVLARENHCERMYILITVFTHHCGNMTPPQELGILCPVLYKIFLANGSLMKSKMLQNAPFGAFCKYSKTCVKRPLKNRQNKDLLANGSLMKVESVAECSLWNILQTFDLHQVIISLEKFFFF